MGTRSAHGDGSCKLIEKGKHKGKWRVQVWVEDGRGSKRRLSRIFPTQREGKDFLRSLIREGEKAAVLATKPITLTEWFDWLVKNDWPDELDSKTIQARKGRFKKYVKKRWGNMPLTKIDPIEVKEFYKLLRADGVGHATRKEIRADLVRVFNQAISPYRKVPMTWGNPFRLSIEAGKPRNAVALTPGEAWQAISAKKLSVSKRAMLGLFLLGGVRLSEQMAMTVGQINFAEGLIYVDRAVHIDENGKQTIELPKSDKVRVAVMIPELAELLRPLCDGRSSEAYLWSARSQNQPRMKKLVYATWRTILKATKLPEEMTPHDCRLSHINWIEKLCPYVSSTTLKEHVGHAAEGVTEINYTRPISPAQNLLRQSISDLFPTGSKVNRAA